MKNEKSKGLGDTIHKFTTATGISKMFEGKDCGCQQRRKKLNEILPYNNNNETTYKNGLPKTTNISSDTSY